MTPVSHPHHPEVLRSVSFRRWRTTVAFALAGFGGVATELAWADETPVASRRVQTSVNVTTEAWQNVRGGLATTGWWNALADARVEIAGPTFGAPEHGTFVAQVHAVANRSGEATFSERVGLVGNVSGIMAASHVQVFNLHYRQEAADGRWAWKIGQLAIDDDFMLSEYAGLFVNAAFGAMPSQVATPHAGLAEARPAFPVYGGASPGVWTRVQLSSSVSWQAAVYDGDPGLDAAGNHGFEWLNHGDGLAALAECDLQHAHGVTRFGAAAHTGLFDDWREATTGGEPRVRRGLWSVYAGQDWTVLATAEGHPKLGLFARVGVDPQTDRSVVAWYADGGLNWFGPMATRADDALGLAVSHTQFAGAFRSVNGAARAETTIEATYLWRVSPRVAIQPDLQWIAGAATDPSGGRHGSAFVVGVRTRVSF